MGHGHSLLEDIDLKGKVCIVTGANQGMGFVTARELVRRNGHVILACRNKERGEESAKKN